MAHPSRLPDLGRRVYGFAAFALGIIQLRWRDFATIWHPVRPGTPYRAALVYVVAVCLLAGGAAVQSRRTARAGFVILSVLFLLAAALWLPRVIGFPQLVGTWLGFAEEFAPVAAIMVAYASLGSRDTTSHLRAFELGRVLFALCVLTFGAAHFLALPQTAEMVPAWLPPGQRFWAMATGCAFVLASLAMLSKVRAVLGAGLLTAMLLVFGALVWAPRLFDHPEAHRVWAGNAINLIAAGACWMVFDALRDAEAVRPRETAPAGG